jgi:hypothetical protein
MRSDEHDGGEVAAASVSPEVGTGRTARRPAWCGVSPKEAF